MRLLAPIAISLTACISCLADGHDDAPPHTAEPRETLESLTTQDRAHYQPPNSQLPWELMDGIERARLGSSLFSPSRFLALNEPRPAPIRFDPWVTQPSAYGFTPGAPLLPDPLETPLRPLRNFEQYLYEGLSSTTNIFYTLLLQGLSRTTNDGSGDAYQNWSGTGRLDVNLQTVFAKSKSFGTTMLQVLFREGVVLGAPSDYNASSAIGTFYIPNSLSMGDSASLMTLLVQQGFLDDRLTVTVGKLSANNYFMVNYFADDESAQFLNGSLDGNDVFSAGFANHSPGVVVQGIPSADLYVNAGIFEIASNNTSTFDGFDEGLYFATLEVGYTPKGDAGITRYSATFAVTNEGRGWSANHLKQTNGMLGFIAQKCLANNLAPFIECAFGSDENVAASTEVNLGLGIFSPLGRTDDYAGIGWSWAQPTSAYGDLAPTDDPRSTQVLEVFYRAQLTNSMQLSPDLQVFINPANGDDSPVFAFSLRLKTQF